MPGKGRSSRFIKRCVADVVDQGKDTNAAFAICTKQSQKAGYTEPGTIKLTGKGKRREKQFGRKKDMGSKTAAFEKAINKEAQTVRTIAQILEEIEN